ncbi:MAG: hypothetical protein ABI277_02500 [Burkholderiaceae bacterium]
MSLSARIAVGPSLRVTLLAIVLATGAFVVAGVTAATCLHDSTAAVVTAFAAGWGFTIAGIVHRHRATSRIVLSVSDRADIGVDRYEHPLKLLEPTMAWPGFSVLALAEADAPSRAVVVQYPLLSADIAPSDRRALSRFMLWSLRGGGTSGRP